MHKFFLIFVALWALLVNVALVSAVESTNTKEEPQNKPFVETDDNDTAGGEAEEEMMKEMQPTPEETKQCQEMQAKDLVQLAESNNPLFYKCLGVIDQTMFQKILDEISQRPEEPNMNGQQIPIEQREDL